MPQLRIAAIRTKANAHNQCVVCGGTELVQAHHHIPHDDSTLISLCAGCHSQRHPDVPKALFFSKNHQPYWHNKSASSLAKELGLHPRTIIRVARKLKIPTGELSALDERVIKDNILKLRPKSVDSKVHTKKHKWSEREEIAMSTGIEQLRQYLTTQVPRRKGISES